MSPARFTTPRSVAAWILVVAACNCAGWILSAMHRLDLVGYLVFFAILLVGAIGWKRFFAPRSSAAEVVITLQTRWRRQRRRFRRLFPFGFLVLAILAGLGGLIHAPNNYDALAYRTPRVLQWLAEKHWLWIHTDFHRLNTRGCGIEWVTAPIFVCLGTDRLDFLLNLIPFALLPGRIFSLLTRLGARQRVAWHWMWLLPTGYGYLLQAGSIGNDLFGAWFALAAVELAFRARDTGSLGAVWLSLLAAALATATKAFNVLLILPWGLAMLPVLGLLVRRPLITAVVILAGLLSSIGPTAVINYHYCGDWSGKPMEPGVPFSMGSPALHLGINSFLILLNNVTPPIFPFARTWERFVEHSLPAAFSARLHRHFEPGAASLRLEEMPMEESAGLGLGLAFLLVILLIVRLRSVRERHRPWWSEMLVPLGAGAACVFFLTQSGLSCPSRYLAPFYPLLIAPMLSGTGVDRFVRRSRLWRAAGVAVFGAAGLLLVLSPARPLWPVRPVLRALGADLSSHPLVHRAWTVYQVYGQRADAFDPALRLLPPGTAVLGIVTFDDPETALWRPFGSRRLIHVCPGDTRASIAAQGVRYIWVSLEKFDFLFHEPLDPWVSGLNGKVVAEVSLALRAGQGPVRWRLIELK
ncbi:MAG TPA: hypothetical protein VN794_08660 [Methylomirabilota bacterium]|nr:hypothetical protein [Methylomirabilota bacterium]